METIIKIIKFLFELRRAGCNPLLVGIRFLWYLLVFKKKIIAHQKVRIKGKDIRNINMSKQDRLYIGTSYVGFLDKSDRTLIHIRGIMEIHGTVKIGRGARVDVCPTGILKLENNVMINAFTLIVCAEQITIGERTGIGWKCQILDCDFHEVSIGKIKMQKSLPINIGKHVLIGNNSSINKGVNVPDNVIISSDCVITRSIKNPQSLVHIVQTLVENERPINWV